MPRFDITSPDGRTFRITAPEGATKDQALAYAKANMGGQGGATAPAAPKQAAPSRPTGPLPGEQGYAAQPQRTGWQRYGSKDAAIPPSLKQLMQTQGGRFAPATGNRMLAGDVETALNSQAGMGSGAARGVRAAGQAGGKIGAKAGEAVTGAPAALARTLTKAPVTAEARAVHDAGFTLSPTMASGGKPSRLSALLEGQGGEAKLLQDVSRRNQPVVNAKAAADLGLPPDTKLMPEVFEQVRAEAGKAYEAVKRAVPVLVSDPELKAAAKSVAGKDSNVAKYFPAVQAIRPSASSPPICPT